jgi:tetratricopeptide (TPR) repeat protein
LVAFAANHAEGEEAAMFGRIAVILTMVFWGSLLMGTLVMGQSKEEGIKLFNEGEELRKNAKSDEDVKRSIEKHEKALRIFEKVKFHKGVGVVADNLGRIYYQRRQYPKAVECYERSLTMARKLRDKQVEEKVLNVLGSVCEAWGQYPKAVEYYEKSWVMARQLRDERSEARTLNSLGPLYVDLSQYFKAEKCYQRSLVITKNLSDVQGERDALNGMGVVYWNLGQYAESAGYLARSLELAGKSDDVKSGGRILTNLGVVYADSLQYAKAVECYETAMMIARSLKDAQGEANAFNELGLVYYEWGQYTKAAECFEKSLQMNRRLKNGVGEAMSLNNLGRVYKASGQYKRTLECYEKSLEIARYQNDIKNEGLVLNNMGEIYAQRGQYEKALGNFEMVLALYEKIGLPVTWPAKLIGDLYLDMGDVAKAEPFLKKAGHYASLGRLYLLKSDYQAARGYYEIVLKSAEHNRRADNLFTSFTGLGMTSEGLGNNAQAAEYFRRAADYTEELRAALRPSERAEFYSIRVEGFPRTAPYDGLARVLVKLGKPLDALKESEYTKARMFAEGLSGRAEGSNPQAPKDVLEKDSQLNDQLAALTKSLQKAYEKEKEDAIAVLEPQVKDTKEKLAAHVSLLRKEYPLFAATKYPQPMGLDQTALKDNEWILAYHVTDSGIVVYLTRGKNLVKGMFKPFPRKELDELVRTFRQPMELGPEDALPKKLAAFDFKSGKKLSDLLLADILSELPKDTPLIIIPDGSLGVVPFEMLVLNEGGKVVTSSGRPQTSGAEFFGDRNPVSYYQSITALTLARTLAKHQKPGEKLLAMVDPVFSADDPRLAKLAKQEKERLLATLPTDLTMSIETESGLTFPRLPLTAQLGELLKKSDPSHTDLYEGMATQKSVLVGKDLTAYRSVVFGTHGYAGSDLPGIQEPVLILTLPDQPTGQDGFLRMTEVMGLKLNCDIAALTACQTGLGRHISGEGTMGMGRAFQYAGAKSVLMSLWSVSETASVNLVENFFRHLKEGKNKLEALRLARDEIRKAGCDHPFYWAPFILVGEVN